jgi:hypothetical protein
MDVLRQPRTLKGTVAAMRRAPARVGLTAVATTARALGIGATVAVFAT